MADKKKEPKEKPVIVTTNDLSDERIAIQSEQPAMFKKATRPPKDD